jgi:hypothetical protein
MDHKDDFFKLALFTVAVRGTPVPISPFYEVTITGYASGLSPIDDSSEAYEVILQFDKSVPKDNGYMIASIKGKIFDSPTEFKIAPLPDPEEIATPPGTPDTASDQASLDKTEIITDKDKTKQLLLSFSLTDLQHDAGSIALTLEDVRKDLVNQKVKLRLEHSVPGGDRTDTLLEDIRHTLELQRLNQFLLPTR